MLATRAWPIVIQWVSTLLSSVIGSLKRSLLGWSMAEKTRHHALLQVLAHARHRQLERLPLTGILVAAD